MEKEKRKCLKHLCYGVKSYRQARRECKEIYPIYSGDTIQWDVSKQCYSIEVGSEAHRQIVYRTRARYISDNNAARYEGGKKVFYKLEREIRTFITTAPVQPRDGRKGYNNLIRSLTPTELMLNAREIFDQYVIASSGHTVMMLVRLECNRNKADLSYDGYHLHALIICDCNLTIDEEAKMVNNITRVNFTDDYYNPKYTVKVTEFDYTYRIRDDYTYLDYSHKADKEGQPPSMNYIIIK